MARRQDNALQVGSLPPSSAEGSGPLLTVEHLTVGYGNVAAVRGLDLEVRRGEIVALFGANGAGKSTTLMAIAGVLKLMSGTINWKGQRARGPLHRRAKQGIAYMPEQRSVISGLSTRDNLRLGLGPTATALELFPELRPLLGRRGGLLSGGEQQILGLARALACQPSLLLIDELSLGLAPRVVSRALSALRRVATEQGIAVLLVEQHVRRALAVCDRAYVLRRGELVLSGTSSDLRGRLSEIEGHYLARTVPTAEEASENPAEQAS